MGQKIKNDLQNVTIGGSYTGGNGRPEWSVFVKAFWHNSEVRCT